MFFRKKKQKDDSVSFEKSEIAKRLNIKISSPNGYYPKDVDDVIINLEEKNLNLSNELREKSKKLEKLEKDYKLLDEQYRNMVLQLQFMEIPDTTDDQDEIMIEKMSNVLNKKPLKLNKRDEDITSF